MQQHQQVATGFLRGLGADLDVECGFVPDFVTIVNLTDGNKISMNPLKKIVAFTSGSEEIKPGEIVRGNTSQAYAEVEQVLVISGTYEGGDAAGFLVLSVGSLEGQFVAETAYRFQIDQAGDNIVNLSGPADQNGVDIDTEVSATITEATQCREFRGTRGDKSLGFTVGASLAINGKLLLSLIHI